MAETDRDLVAAIRAELAAIDPSRACDRIAERAGLGGGSRTGPRSSDRGSDPVVARLALRLGRDGAEAAEALWDDAAWPSLPEHCRLAWLRGHFLSRGSLSLAGGRSHLEFVVERAEADTLANRLAELGRAPSVRVRRGRGVVTWKGGEAIGAFLGRIGAGPTLLELEARQVTRTLRGELNRVLNAESANVARSVLAAGRQVAAIRRLQAAGVLAKQSAGLRVVAAARTETPEATLTELAGRIGLHRSAVQRALERLERLDAADRPRLA